MATGGSTEGEGSGLCLDDCGLDLDSMIYLIDLNTEEETLFRYPVAVTRYFVIRRCMALCLADHDA